MANIDTLMEQESKLNGENSKKFRAFGRAICALFPAAAAIKEFADIIELSKKIESGADQQEDEFYNAVCDARSALSDAGNSAKIPGEVVAIYRHQVWDRDAEAIADRTINSALKYGFSSQECADIWLAL